MTHPVVAYAGRSPDRLMSRLRRMGGLFVLLAVLGLAAAHWLAGEIASAVRMAASHDEAVARSLAVIRRLDLMLVFAGLAMVPVFAAAARIVRRYVRGHHLEELAEAGFRKSQFVTLATAELRNPLNAMAGFAELLANGTYGPVPPDQAGAVREIRNGADNMKRLLADILDQCNIEARRVRLAMDRFDAGDVVREALDAAAQVAVRGGVALTATVLPGAGLVGDRRRIKQVVLNLVVNALNASQAGSEVEARVMPVEGGVVVAVIDHGAGIGPAALAGLLDHVRHVRSARAAREGTGLDLAICRHLVELHGGRMWATSEPGRGSRFSLFLPAAPGAAGTIPPGA